MRLANVNLREEGMRKREEGMRKKREGGIKTDEIEYSVKNIKNIIFIACYV